MSRSIRRSGLGRKALAAILCCAALLAARDTARAQSVEFEPLLRTLARARCHMDICGWFRIDAATPIAGSAKGLLFALAVRRWSSQHPHGRYERPAPRTGGDTRISFVFCSREAPAWIDYDVEQKAWLAVPLQPGNSRVMAGVEESIYAMYWAACHRMAVRDVATEGDRLGRRLGYRFSGDEGPKGRRMLASPTDVLTW
jgi:hypothetical protein